MLRDGLYKKMAAGVAAFALLTSSAAATVPAVSGQQAINPLITVSAFSSAESAAVVAPVLQQSAVVAAAQPEMSREDRYGRPVGPPLFALAIIIATAAVAAYFALTKAGDGEGSISIRA